MELLSNLDPHHKMHYVFHVLIRKIVAFIGHDFFEVKEFKPCFLTYVMYLIMFWYWIGAFYSMTHYDLIVQLHMISLNALALEVRKYNFTDKKSPNIFFYRIGTFFGVIKNYSIP